MINIGSTYTRGTKQETLAFGEGRQAAANGVSYTPATGTTGATTSLINWSALAHAGITVNLIDPSANNALLGVSVQAASAQDGYTVNVSLATGAGGAITSTAAEVAAAVNANAFAGVLVRGAAPDGSGVVAAESATLTGASGAPPYTVDRRCADLWVRGHVSWADDPANAPIGKDRCAYAPGGGYTP